MVVAGKPWTAADDAAVVARYATEPTETLAASLGRTSRAVYMRANQFGLKKSADYLASPASGRRLKGWGPTRTSFKPGLVPWNKGLDYRAGGRSVETQFRAGQMPKNHKPVGYERINADGYRERKVAEPKTFRAVHVLLWEEHLGPVPHGFAVIFKNRDKADIRIDNLSLVSRADLMRRNSYHNYPQPIPQLIQLRGVLNRQINKRAKAHEKQN
jgi:hypothetical protein